MFKKVHLLLSCLFKIWCVTSYLSYVSCFPRFNHKICIKSLFFLILSMYDKTFEQHTVKNCYLLPRLVKVLQGINSIRKTSKLIMWAYVYTVNPCQSDKHMKWSKTDNGSCYVNGRERNFRKERNFYFEYNMDSC